MSNVQQYVREAMQQMARDKRSRLELGRYDGPDFQGVSLDALDDFVGIEVGGRGHLVGQTGAADRCPPGSTGHQPGLGETGLRTDCPVKPAPCDCTVIGVTTLGTAGIAVATALGDGVNLILDSGDAPAFQPHYIWYEGQQVNNNFTVTAGGTIDPILLTNATVGIRPQSPRFNSNGDRGISSRAFAATREPVCVDWAPFESTNNRQLSMRYYNASANVQHAFVVMWGQIVTRATADEG